MLVENETDKLLMIPGPTPVQREILDALSEPTISHTSPAMAEMVRPCLDMLTHVAGTETGYPLVFGGSGTLAQESALVNILAPGDRLLVASNGYFGDRFVPMAEAHGIEVERLAAPWGRSITAEELRERLHSGDFTAVTVTHVETSTGVLAPLDELTAVAREHGVYLIVDAVCAFGGVAVDMDRRGIDVVLTGAQKALGVPPGLTILVVSERAMNRRKELGRISSYYADWLNWEPSMRDPKVYFSTHAVNLFYALLVASRIIEREGLEERYRRHEQLARAFRQGMSALGFGSLTEERYLAPTLSVLAYPEAVDDAHFRQVLGDRGVVAAACLGEFRGRGVRFGHMGNISQAEILQGLGAVEAALGEVGARFEPGAGVAAAARALAPAPSL